MSDQTPSLDKLGPVDGRNLINVGGGLGVTSINGDPTAAQLLTAGAGINILDAGGGAHVISLVGGGGIITINGDGAAAQTIVAGPNITVTDLGGGAHRISASGGAGLTSINGDGNPAQTIIAGANITVTDLGGGAHRIAAAGGGLGNIVSINADVTPAQVLQAGSGISITDLGGGVHTIAATTGTGILTINGDAAGAQTLTPAVGSNMVVNNPGLGAHTLDINQFTTALKGVVPASIASVPHKSICADGAWKNPCFQRGFASAGAGAAIPNGALTVLASFVAIGGFTAPCCIVFGGGVDGIANQFMDIVLTINGVVQPNSGVAGFAEFGAQTANAGGSYIANIALGDTVAVAVNHHGGGAATTSQGAFVGAFCIGL